jgi:hypothetical protein
MKIGASCVNLKLCASIQDKYWQTVQCFEIRFFAKRQTVKRNASSDRANINNRK